jgi:hypothetical protein
MFSTQDGQYQNFTPSYLLDPGLGCARALQVSGFTPRALASLASSCGALGAGRRSAGMLGRMLAACRARGLGAFSGQELCTVMCACARAEHAPSKEFMEVGPEAVLRG